MRAARIVVRDCVALRASEWRSTGPRDEGEAHLPAELPPPREGARLPGSHGNEEWADCAQAPACEGAEAPDRRRRGLIPGVDRARPSRLPAPRIVTAGAHALRRASRVRRRPEFERAYETGVRIHGRFMALFVVPNDGTSSRLGVAATRKLGAAVERNRAKRLARELFRRHKVPAGLDIIVVPRREMLDAPFTSLEADYLALLERREHPSSRSFKRSPRGRRGARGAQRI
jgi:ribonuclease P protein component